MGRHSIDLVQISYGPCITQIPSGQEAMEDLAAYRYPSAASSRIRLSCGPDGKASVAHGWRPTRGADGRHNMTTVSP